MKIFTNILKTLIAVPLSIVGIIFMFPFYLLYFLLHLPVIIIEDIWEIDIGD